MTEEEYLARLGLLRPQSGKRKPQEPIPAGSSVLDVPIGGTRRIPDTVLRRQYEGPNVGEATPYDPTLRERLAAKTQDVFEGLGADRYKARQRAETILGGPSSNLPLQIGLADFAPFLGTTIQTEEAGRGLEQAGRDIERGDYLSAGIEGLGAGLGLLPGLSATAKGAKAVGKRVREAADPEAIRQYVRQTQGLTGMPGTSVIKPPGGNYLARAVERSLKPFRPHGVTGGYRFPGEELHALRETYPPEGLQRLRGSRPDEAEYIERQMKDLETRTALDNWVQNKIGKYVKNEMGTMNDPIRKQADEWADTQKELLAQKDEQIDRLQKKMVEARQARGLAPEQEAMLTRSRAELEELRRQRKYIEDQKGLHFNPRQTFNEDELELQKNPGLISNRKAYGFPAEGVAKNKTARDWEFLSDYGVSDIKAREIQESGQTQELVSKAQKEYKATLDEVNDAVLARVRATVDDETFAAFRGNPSMLYQLRTPDEKHKLAVARSNLTFYENADRNQYYTILEDNPWIAKLDPETRLFRQPYLDDLQFDHLVDELKNAMSPAGGLPEHLRIGPEDLEKLTLPRAVKLVDEINAYRSGVKADADRAVASNAATVEVKSYDVIPGTDVPNTQGFAWKQIKPFQFRSEDQLQGEALEAYRRHLSLGATQEQAFKSVSDIYGRNAVQDALKYEGDILSHCVGGYCDDVLSGRSQIFSLRDANGMPAVTIEVRPMDDSTFQRQVDWKQYSALQDISQSEADKWLAQQRQSMPPEIIQIKGKANRAPKEEYLPFVQDFVRSGNWSRVGDLDNTGLFQVGNKYFNQSEIESMTAPAIRFLEEAPMLDRHRQAMQTYRNFKGPILSPEFDALNREIDKIVDPSIPYTYSELVGILHEPKAYGIDSLGKVLEAVERLKAMSGQGYAVGGLVQNTDTLRDNLVAAGMDPDLALMQGLRMAEQVEMQAGGLASKTLKGAFRGAEKAIPRIETKGFQEFRADAPFVRAEEASKHQFETGKPVIVESYTGTRRDFSEIDPGLSSAGYFSSNKPIVANEYAGVFPEGAVSQPFPTGGNIQKSFIRMDNPLFINARGASFNRVDTRGLPGFGLPMSNTDMINLWAKQQGYDGVVYKDLRDSMALPSGQNAPASNVYVSFKPNYVKSAIGNRGTYDVKERDMTKAEGGLL